MGHDARLTLGVAAAMLAVLAATSACAWIARVVGQPRVVGEMVAGLLLGPSVLGLAAPGLTERLFPADVRSVLYVLSSIGLTFYMFGTGIGIGPEQRGRRVVRQAALLSVAGLVFAFALGALAAAVWYDDLAGPNARPLPVILLVGGAFAITAFPTMARMLEDAGVSGRAVAGLVLLAAALDDVAAWCILAAVVALSTPAGPGQLVSTVVGATALVLVLLTAGRWLIARICASAERRGGLSVGHLTTIAMVVLGAGWVSDRLGLFAAFGGFVAGFAAKVPPALRRQLRERLLEINSALLVPIFFALTGLQVHATLLTWRTLPVLLGLLVAAVAGKWLAGTAAARMGGLSWRASSGIGALMTSRGLMILIFITVGLQHGLLSDRAFAVLVIVGLITTAVSMPVFRWCARDADFTALRGTPDAPPHAPDTSSDAARRARQPVG